MADETTVGQEQFVNDYPFQTDKENEVLIDDDGNPRDTAKAENKEQKQNSEATAKAPENPKADVPKKEEKKQPLGFEERFYTKDDKGGEVFNPDSALDFFVPKQESRLTFKYTPRTVEAAPAKDPNAPVVEPWKKELEEEREYRKGLTDNLFRFESRFQEYRNAGYDEAVSRASAKRDLQEYIDEQLKEREFNMTAQRREREYKELQEVRQQAEFEQKSRTNIAVFAQELGGHDKFEKLMYNPDLGGVVIQKTFDFFHPDAKFANAEELSTAMNKWWTKFSSDMNNLQYVYEQAVARVQRKIWPQLVDHIRGVKERQTKQNKEGAMKPDTGLKHGEKATPERDAVDEYFNRVPEV